MLITLLDGLLTGVRQQTRVYLDHAGGNVVVLPLGARIFGDGGQFPLSTIGAIGAAARSDVPPDELASYCLHALSGAANASSKQAVRRLVGLTLDGLRPPGTPGGS